MKHFEQYQRVKVIAIGHPLLGQTGTVLRLHMRDDDVSHETLDDEPTLVEIIAAERIDGDELPAPRPHQELKRMGSDLSQRELIRLVNVIQKFLWWDREASVWNRDLPPSLDTLDFIADVLDRAGLRPAEILNENS